MRDRQKTIEALRRLAERPGTPAEGETARRKLREIQGQMASAEPKPDLRYVVESGEIDIEAFKAAMVIKSAAFAKSEAEFKANLANFFRGAGYVPRAAPQQAQKTSWEDIEGVIRRNIYRRGQGDAD